MTLPERKQTRQGTRLICVGRLSPEKGQPGLLQALAVVAKEVPQLSLILVGDGPDRRQLERLARELSVTSHVTFAGRLSEQDTLKEIAASDILVLPSFMEGLPIVLMEAMALGVPVIASRVAGIPELVEDSRTGLLFTPSDWDELAECIQKLVSNADMRREFGSAGPSVVSSEFDVAKSAARMLELFAAVGAP
jgi:glycosyltransferase involved in cell wall biosynthesis